jgi:hypothetical protein
MNPVKIEEILSAADYERIRDIIRPMVIREKSRRRLAVGSHLTLLFENRQTVWYQIQEMVRTEKLADESAIAHEVETYNELIPRAGELTATMLVEYAEPQERDAALRRLVGLERHLKIKFGDRIASAIFDDRQVSPDSVSAVQFIRFPAAGLDSETFRKLAREGRVSIEVDHPSLAASGAISGDLGEALADDLK